MFCFVFGNLLAVLDLHSCAGFSLVVESGSYFLVVMRRPLIAVASLIAEHRLQGAWASVAAVAGLWSRGSIAVVHRLVALWHVGSSQIRNLILVSCTGGWILYH